MRKQRYNPWRRLARMADVDVVHGVTADGLPLGRTTILLHPDLTQAERRSTLTHELVHLERGVLDLDGIARLKEERVVEQLAARLLITPEELLSALQWTGGHVTDETADECWVDLPMLLARIDGLSGDEEASLRAYFHEEGQSA